MTLPPGRARLSIRPVPSGSIATANTIGMTDVACFAAGAAVPDVTMISTLSRTNSDAISAKRSLCPSAQRNSMTTVRRSIQSSSCSRCTNAAAHRLQDEAEAEPRNPMVGSLPACCARAASGHTAAAPPSRVMNSRRFTAIASRADQNDSTAQYGGRLLRCEIFTRPMTAVGQTRTSSLRATRPLPPSAETTSSG